MIGPDRAPATAPSGRIRLLDGVTAADRSVGLDDHLERWGPLPRWRGTTFIDEMERSGLRGRGGGWFPVATKWRAVRRKGTRRPVVIANGAEGEPASGKDRFLLCQLPHLVLDGAVTAAVSIGAPDVVLHVPALARDAVDRALSERRQRGLDPCTIDVVTSHDSYLAGQESAVVNTINGSNPGTPSFVALRSVRERGAGTTDTGAERRDTRPHLADRPIRRQWFRRVGTERSPGSTLLTVTGRWPEPRIVEAPLGRPLGDIVGLTSEAERSVQGVLLGGYGGGWLSTAEALSMPLTEEAARRQGSSIGAGVVVLLPHDTCSLLEVSRVVRYLQGQGAGQCGPVSMGSTRWPAPWSSWPSSRVSCTAASPRSPPFATWWKDGVPVPILTVWSGSSGPPFGCSRPTSASTSTRGRAICPAHRYSPYRSPTGDRPDEAIAQSPWSWTLSPATAPESVLSFYPSHPPRSVGLPGGRPARDPRLPPRPRSAGG